MPLPFLSLPHALLAHQSQVRELPGGLIVHWRQQSLTFSPRVLRFSEGVTAQYGQTVVESDELEIHLEPNESFAIAKGHVSLTDPLGKLRGDNLQFSWIAHTGNADHVQIIADSVKASVDHIELGAEKWVLKDVRATGYTNKVALLNLRSREIDVVPGKTVVVRKPKFGIFGTLLGPFPDSHSSMGSRATGFRYPMPSYRQDRGFGISWDSQIKVGRSSLFTGSYGNYARTIPTYGFNLSTSFLKGKGPITAWPPRYDLGDRFDISYFQNVLTLDPESDWRFYGERRNTLSLSTVSNSPATGRDDFGHYSKPIDLSYERSERLGKTSLYGQLRAQQIRRGGDPLENRVLGWFSFSPEPLTLGRGLHLYASGDSMGFSDTGFVWARLQSGIAYRPTSFLRLSGAGFWGEEWGDPKFPADKLDRKYGLIARGDILTGPTKFSYLLKFDPRGTGQYDREYSFTQAIGILQAYVNYRKFPSEFRYGVLLRLDSLLEAAQRRSDEEKREQTIR